MAKLEIDKFNEIRIETARKFIYFFICTNFYYQTIVSLNPLSELQAFVNNCYWVNWVIVVICLILSIYKSIDFLYPAFVLMFLRNAIRTFDFEET